MSRLIRTCLLVIACALAASASFAQVNFGDLRDRALEEMKTPRGVSVATIRAIGKVKQPQARRLLADIVTSAKSDGEKAAALVELARFEHASLLQLFSSELESAKTTAIANAAAAGLALQEHRGLDKLVDCATHPRKPARQAAAQALTTALRKNGTVLPYLVDFIDRTVADERLSPLIGLRNRAASPDMVELFAKVALTPDDASRCEALRLHAEGASPANTRDLLARVETTLGGKKPSKALFAAILHAKTASLTDANIEEFLAEALEVADQLAPELQRINRNAGTRDRVAAVLSRVVLTNEGAVERLVALELLVSLGGDTVSDTLVKALDDESTAAQLLAIREVARRNLEKAIPKLRKLFGGSHEELQLEALLALHAHEKQRNRKAWPKELRETLATATRVGLRCAAIDCLRELEDEKAIELVNACARAPEWQLRSAAFRFLEELADRESIAILVERLQVEEGRLAGECMAALMNQTDHDYPKPEYWKRWWDNEKELWTPKKREKIAKGGKPDDKNERGKGSVEKPRKAALTYYSIPITSNAASFLIDTSGSMAQRAGTAKEPKIEAAKKALEQVLARCEAERRFNVVPFAGGPRPWQKQLRPMDDRYRTQAIAFTRALRASGGTNIHDALQQAFDDASVDTIYLLSDGQPSAGTIVDPTRLADAVATWNRERRIVIHTIAFGQDHPLLKRLAKESGGTYVRYL
ncbi:MAG: VWA domain-containing protein [Planctomycetes bacterium]|nr:VWA domain-containing protein [Planctomycetota bacterium]MCB9892626.1 VWA domain-containing protein [Planctomycetota bacterium]MCB9917552.1 VWA domain-containing protein [Planctomycetota bacterium]